MQSESHLNLTTPSLEVIDTSKEIEPNMLDFYIGLGLAISSSLFIGSSFIIKKKALKKLADTNKDRTQRASEGGYGYLKEWMWWMGVITMAVGEACNFAAYGLVPASLVTPLGVLSVVVTAVLSSKFLDEKLNLLGKIGCSICLLGSTSIVIHSPKEEEVSTMAELALKMKDALFIIYVITVVIITLCLIIYVAPKYGRSNILVYILICSLIGSLSVLSVKGLGLAIKETISGQQQITNPLTWFWLIAVIICVAVQLIYLNKALDIYNTSMVTPIYFVLFTSLTILASAILYKEWQCLGASDVLGNIVGFLTTVLGVTLLLGLAQNDSFDEITLIGIWSKSKYRNYRPSSAALVDHHTDNYGNNRRSYYNTGSLNNTVAPSSDNNMTVYA
uniref:Magnesium transporter NIPA2 n=1 Tax=Rhabditophanes sp. KR3021 TaxID=114890 RepID=A0AC35TYY0_9BILA